MGIKLPVLSQNGPTKLIVWSLGGQSTVLPLRSFLPDFQSIVQVYFLPHKGDQNWGMGYHHSLYNHCLGFQDMAYIHYL